MSGAIEVVVAVLRRGDGAVLVAERAAWRHQGGGLEFPGGKMDPNEAIDTALARELAEELGVCPRRWSPLLRVRHRYPEREVILNALVVEDWSGEPRGNEGQAIEWRRPDALDERDFPAANRPILAALCLPAYCLITPEPNGRDVDGLVRGVGRAVDAGIRLIQLRAPALERRALARLIDGACEAASPATRVLLNAADPAWLERHPALAGLHLTARAAARFDQRPVPPAKLLSCACHEVKEIRQAEILAADLVLVGSVADTPSHPGIRPLGWAGLEALTGATNMPVYAVGGLGPADLEAARRHGAVGIAAIRALWPPGSP